MGHRQQWLLELLTGKVSLAFFPSFFFCLCNVLAAPFRKSSTDSQITKRKRETPITILLGLSPPHPKQFKGQEKNITIKKKSIFGYLIILICCHRDEFGFGEQVCPKCTIRKFQDVIGSDDVKPGLVFVHRVQYSLQGQGGETHIKKGFRGTNRILEPLPG